MQPSTSSSPPGDGAIAESATSPREAWLEDLEELPPRPRRRWLAPAPLSLFGVLLIACGFIAGVLVEKGQTGSAGAPQGAAAFISRLRAASGASGGTGTAGSGAAVTGSTSSGTPVPGASTGTLRPTSGTVSYSSGGTLYVTDGEGTTVQVHTSSATSVTKTVKSKVRGIRPGETVTVTGRAGSDGSVTAESIRVGNGGGALFGGLGAAPGGAASSGSTGTAAGNGGPALFGN